MKSQARSFGRRPRLLALGLVFSLSASAVPVLGGVAHAQTVPQRCALTTKQKLVILAGAAALYYLYRKHQKAKGAGQQGQYYLSKNGRVYYRDPSNPKIVHWVTPPPGGLQVPASEAQQYSRYAGYNGRATGAQFGGYGAAPAGAGSPSGAGGPGGAGGPPGPPGPGR